MEKRKIIKPIVANLLVCGLSCAALAEESTDELRKAAQNPVASMISVPFQNNTDFNIGPDNKSKNTLNIQPVIPFELNDDWNLITRTILPLVSQPDLIPGQERTFGLGDASLSAFLSPKVPGKIMWGAGPMFLFPTATDSMLGADKWGLGISGVALTIIDKWTIGALASNIWSVAGSGDNDINLFTLQYFVNYNLDDGWYLVTAPINTVNWEADSDNRWTVPLGGGFGRVFKIGNQPVNAQLSGYYNVETPDNFGAEWQMRAQVQFLFPK
ncbi:MAG: neuromedin U [Campylobacterota bacterium]|nr:neuromedin U [Campylobacterota bacterium]